MNANDPLVGKIFRNQGYHVLVWSLLGVLLDVLTRRLAHEAELRAWGLTASTWIFISWASAGLHQGWTWFFWRAELHRGQIRAWFGDFGFLLFRVGFVLFASVRLLSVIPVALATPHTVSPPRWLSLGLIVLSTPPILWGLFSVLVFFGLTRTFGADHFDPGYRGGKLEQRGIFKYVPNAMYTVVLLALYHPGLLLHSRLSLILAVVNHALVWTHYFCTEKPDLREIYGAPS